VTLEARERGAIIRPLGDVVVLMPPLSISKPELTRLVGITREAVRAACASAYGERPVPIGMRRAESDDEGEAVAAAALTVGLPARAVDDGSIGGQRLGSLGHQ
jgi:hypothetical protein